MFGKYEKSVLALVNYSKHYGIDTQDEIVFKEYLMLCEKSKKKPLLDVLALFNESHIDQTVYCIPLLVLDLKLRTTMTVSSLVKQTEENMISIMPSIFGDNIDNSWNIESARLKEISDQSVKNCGIGYFMKKIKEKISKVKQVEIEVDLVLSNKVYFKADEPENIINDAWEANGYISISKKWKKIKSVALSTSSDIIIMDKE